MKLKQKFYNIITASILVITLFCYLSVNKIEVSAIYPHITLCIGDICVRANGQVYSDLVVGYDRTCCGVVNPEDGFQEFVY